MADCLILSDDAGDFAAELLRTTKPPLPVEVCTSVEAALGKYSGQSILFGSPDLVAKVLPELPQVDWVQSTWAGVTPLIAIDRRDYILTGVKDVFGPQISEYVMGYLLAHELKIHERMQQQHSRNWFTAPSGVLEGKRLGIMGTGSIGSHLARTAEAFGLSVRGLNSAGAPASQFGEVMPVSQLHDFLDGLDYLVTVLPHTEETDRLLDKAALAILPAHAYVVNVGRGNVIDDAALVAALQNNELAGAALDVFDQEPIPDDSPLWNTPDLSITAHVAAMSHPSLIVPIFVDNYRRYSNGQPLKHTIDLDKGY